MINFPNVTATLEPSAEFLVCKRQVRIQRRMKGMIIPLTASLSVAGRLILPGIQNDLYKTANEIDCQVSEVFRFQPLNSSRHPLNRQLLDPPWQTVAALHQGAPGPGWKIHRPGSALALCIAFARFDNSVNRK